LSGNDLKHIFDCVGGAEAAQFCYDAFGQNGGHYSSLQFPPACSRKDVKTSMVVAYTSYGEFFSKFGTDWPAQPENYEFGSKFFELSEAMLAEGKLEPHPARIGEGGLAVYPTVLRSYKFSKLTPIKYRILAISHQK
jgi:hypothetical protein